MGADEGLCEGALAGAEAHDEDHLVLRGEFLEEDRLVGGGPGRWGGMNFIPLLPSIGTVKVSWPAPPPFLPTC